MAGCLESLVGWMNRDDDWRREPAPLLSGAGRALEGQLHTRGGADVVRPVLQAKDAAAGRNHFSERCLLAAGMRTAKGNCDQHPEEGDSHARPLSRGPSPARSGTPWAGAWEAAAAPCWSWPSPTGDRRSKCQTRAPKAASRGLSRGTRWLVTEKAAHRCSPGGRRRLWGPHRPPTAPAG